MQRVKLRFIKSDKDYRMKEAFKTLRTNIEFCGEDVKVVAVTSCVPNEGKSIIAMEMAKAFADAGNKTILIDADMRKSVMLGRYSTGESRYGLVHCLAGKVNFTDTICETNIPRFYVTFSGPMPPNPSELLGGKLFANLVTVLKRHFDYVIIDTPPLGSVIDAAVAARSCDGTVLVVEEGAVSYKFVRHVKEQLDKVDARVLGVVLNKVDLSTKGFYGHYGKYYGKYYGRYGEDADVKIAEASIASAVSGKKENEGTGR